MKGIAGSALVLLLVSALLLNGCAKQIENKDPQESTTPPVTTTEDTTTEKSDNMPSFTIAPPVTNSPDTTPEKPNSESQQTQGTVKTDGSASQSPVTDHEDITEEQVTNDSGMIVDDFLSNIEFNTEDPDELYAMFGLDRAERAKLYDEISSKYNFPVIHVSTENEERVLSLDTYLKCLVEVFNCDEYYTMDAVSAEIRLRGNASAHYGKVESILKEGAPYRIKFTNKQNLLGLNDDALCRSWVLIRPYGCGVEDYLGYKLAATINEGKYYCTDATFVQLYINEEFMGLYILAEQTQVNSERIDITEPEEGYTGTDIGYLVELDNYAPTEDWWFYLNFNKEEITDVNGTTRVPRKYHYSIKSDIYDESQKAFIERYFEIAYEVAMRAIRDGEYYRVNEDLQSITLAQEEFSSARECIEQIWDIQSVVDMYIVHELTGNHDVGGGSFFFAIDFAENSKMEKLTCVAPWDFDWGYADGNNEADGGLYAATFDSSSFVNSWGDRSNPWLVLFYSADWFRDMVKDTWQARVSDIVDTTNEIRSIVDNNKSDFNAFTKLTGRATATINWVDERIEYLNGLWG